MRYRRIGRLCALVLVLAFGLGWALHGLQAAGMSAKMAAVAGADGPASNHCDGCDGDGDPGDAACGAAVCLAPVALLPTEAAVPPPLAAVVAATVRTLGPGRSGPPDPFPPRLPILA